MGLHRYLLTFEGKVSPQDEMGEQMGIESSATLGPGCDEALGAAGAKAEFNALVTNEPDGSFTLQGELVLPSGTLAVSTVRPSSLDETPDPAIQTGTAECRIDSGTGKLAGASGTLMLTFTVDEDARFVGLAAGLVFAAG